MLILSSFDNDKKFIEIIDINECRNIESDCYAYISIDSVLQSDLEKYFQIGKFLNQNEMQYAIFLNNKVEYHLNKINSETSQIKLNNLDIKKASLQLILSMFAKYNASFCIFNEANYDLLPFSQSYANYHLFDMKILGLVSSYVEASYISSWCNCNGSELDKFIHIDGVIEEGLLIKHKTK